MSRRISRLLAIAAAEAELNRGVVPTDVAMRLAAEGYDLTRLDGDVERILEKA